MVGYLLSNHGDQYGQGRRTTPDPREQPAEPAGMPFEAKDGAIWTLVLLAVLAGLVVSFLINRTRFGFDLRATGMNEPAAVASGVNVKRMVVISMLLSGAIAGLIWMPALFGGADYYGPTFQRTLGFTGIAVALLGRNRPLGIFFGAVLFAWLNEQANPLALIADISPSVVQITQGVVVLAVVIAYEVVRRWAAAAEQRAAARSRSRTQPEGRGGDGMSTDAPRWPPPAARQASAEADPDVLPDRPRWRWSPWPLVRVITGAHEIDSQGSLRAAIVATCPILLAALGGLWSERAGVVNIGLEGQMLLGTWGAAFFTYYYGP